MAKSINLTEPIVATRKMVQPRPPVGTKLLVTVPQADNRQAADVWEATVTDNGVEFQKVADGYVMIDAVLFENRRRVQNRIAEIERQGEAK